ncbi:TIGR00645 family protein [Undibacterium sp. SXout20W]|uniref:TIGR00645 family protein n=1 Tax=Undibacterium sp. SXout20W TaxID=3413051 RepID=UPI003BF0267E
MERILERGIFRSRWLLAPMYLGIAALLLLVNIKFIRQFYDFAVEIMHCTPKEFIIGVLALIDVVMLANLLVIFLFAGYENFVSKLSTETSEDRPNWMGHVGFGDLKIKLISSIVAMSAIELLKAFMEVSVYSDRELGWMLGLHCVFVVSGVLFAMMDKITKKA